MGRTPCDGRILAKAPDTWQTLNKYDYGLNLNSIWTGPQQNELLPSSEHSERQTPLPSARKLCVAWRAAVSSRHGAHQPAEVAGTGLWLERKASGPIPEQGDCAGPLELRKPRLVHAFQNSLKRTPSLL